MTTQERLERLILDYYTGSSTDLSNILPDLSEDTIENIRVEIAEKQKEWNDIESTGDLREVENSDKFIEKLAEEIIKKYV